MRSRAEQSAPVMILSVTRPPASRVRARGRPRVHGEADPPNPLTPGSKVNLVRLGGGRGAVVAAGAAMATEVPGRGAATYRATGNESCRRPPLARGEAPVDRGSAASLVPRLCLDPSAVSESQARMTARELVSRLAGRRPSASASSTAESVSEGNALSGARALRAARSPSTGGSRSRHVRYWTTWSCTSSIPASRTTRDGSGRSSSDIARAGASSAIGCVTTDLAPRIRPRLIRLDRQPHEHAPDQVHHDHRIEGWYPSSRGARARGECGGVRARRKARPTRRSSARGEYRRSARLRACSGTRRRRVGATTTDRRLPSIGRRDRSRPRRALDLNTTADLTRDIDGSSVEQVGEPRSPVSSSVATRPW